MRRLPVLLIEEDVELARFTAQIIDGLGWKPYAANSLAEALRLVAARGYALILADYFTREEQVLYRWPVLALLSRFVPSTPVIVISSSGEFPSDNNFVDLVPLPFGVDDLAQRLDRHASSHPKGPHDQLLARYLAALFDANFDEAAKVVDEASTAGWTATAIYEDLFTAALNLIGDLWGQDSCSVADEHGARVITERLMARVAAGVENLPQKSRSILVSCVAGEHHELGARMVADLFTWDGWRVFLLGADTPQSDIVAEARKRQVDAVGLSATVRPSWGVMGSQIAALREAGVGTIIVGGLAFRPMDPRAIAALGADARADGLKTVLEIVNRLTQRKTARAGQD